MLFQHNVKPQNDLVVFNSANDKFYLYVNGIRQNDIPELNVRVTGILQPRVKVKIVFENNKRYPDINQSVYFNWEEEEKNNWEFVCELSNKKGFYKLKFFSAAPVEKTKPANQYVVPYHEYEGTPVSQPQPSAGNATHSQTITSSTVITTGSPSSSQSPGINIQINPGGGTFQVQTGSVHQNTSSSMQQTTTIISNTVISSGTTVSPNASSGGTVGTIRCSVTDAEFESIKKSISSKSFEDSKLTTAKQISDSRCLKSSQVRDIMKLFSFESTRLEFAKYAYKKVADKENYYLVNDAFQFETSIEELNESIH